MLAGGLIWSPWTIATLDETVAGGDTVRGLNGKPCTVVDGGEPAAEVATAVDARGCSCTAEVGVATLAAAAAANIAILSSKLLRTFSSATSRSGCGTLTVRRFSRGDDPEPASAPKRCFAQSTRDVGDAIIFPTVVV